MYKHELIVDYIDEASRSTHERLGRRLMPAEADWMRRQARRLYEDELAYATRSEKKTAKQLDAEIARILPKKRPDV